MLRCCCCCCRSKCMLKLSMCLCRNTETRDTNDTDANIHRVKTIYSIVQHATSYAYIMPCAHWRRLNWTSARAQKARLSVHTRISTHACKLWWCAVWMGAGSFSRVCANSHETLCWCGLGRLTDKTVRTFVCVFVQFFCLFCTFGANVKCFFFFFMLERKCI